MGIRHACVWFALVACTPERECEVCDGGAWTGVASSVRVSVSAPGFLAAEVVGGADDVRITRGGAVLDTAQGRAGAYLTAGDYEVAVGHAVELRVALTTADQLVAFGMAEEPATDALAAFGTAWKKRDTTRFEYVIADFSMHSSQEREWVVDLATGALRYHLHVAHGRGYNEPFMNTGLPPAFSNTPETHLSSIGVMRSAERYTGMYGVSHRIDGLEPGINDNVRPRDIVMHPWEGSRAEFVAMKGETQPTWGCPAIDDRVAPQLADMLHGGVLMFFWHPDWRAQSTYVD